MSLETVFFKQGPFSYGSKDYNTLGGYGIDLEFQEDEKVINSETLMEQGFNGYRESTTTTTSIMVPSVKEAVETISSTPEDVGYVAGAAPTSLPPKRKRSTKHSKNQEEVENQRMVHIAVERNRRKQMNHYLSLLRSLMPPSYANRGDQASIVGGAINYVKELEQLLHFLEAHKQHSQLDYSHDLFSNFFTAPQYSTRHDDSVAEIEVNMVDSHANLKILTERKPRQLLKMVSGLHSIGLTVLHLNVTTVDQMVLLSFSVKVEDDCPLSTVNEIATIVHEMVG